MLNYFRLSLFRNKMSRARRTKTSHINAFDMRTSKLGKPKQKRPSMVPARNKVAKTSKRHRPVDRDLRRSRRLQDRPPLRQRDVRKVAQERCRIVYAPWGTPKVKSKVGILILSIT